MAGRRQQVVDVCHAARDRVLDRDHAQLALARLDGLEGLLEGRIRPRLVVGEMLAAGLVAVGAGFALEGDLGEHAHVSRLST